MIALRWIRVVERIRILVLRETLRRQVPLLDLENLRESGQVEESEIDQRMSRVGLEVVDIGVSPAFSIVTEKAVHGDGADHIDLHRLTEQLEFLVFLRREARSDSVYDAIQMGVRECVTNRLDLLAAAQGGDHQDVRTRLEIRRTSPDHL